VKAGNTRQARSGPRSARREMAANNRIGGGCSVSSIDEIFK